MINDIEEDVEEIELPYNWIPRTYQESLYDSFPKEYIPDSADAEKRAELEEFNKHKFNRAYLIKTRRYGFDLTLINIIVKESQKRVGVYFHAFPTYTQGKKDVWNNRTKDGIPFLDYFPDEIIESKNSTEMIIKFKNKSIYQVVGTDDYKNLRGAGVVGIGFSEWAFHNPNCLSVISPMIAETEGFMIFGTTPAGKNHAYQDYLMALDNPSYYCEVSPNSKVHAISDEAIEEERQRGMSEAEIQREYECSFEVSVKGAYYEAELALARKQGRITGVRPQATTPVFTFWDLGYDYTAIWFVQFVGKEIQIVNYYENCRKGLTYYANYVKDWRDRNMVTLGELILPHDAESHTVQGTSARQDLENMEFKCKTVKRPTVKEDGHEACRQIFGQCFFDEKNCENGISALSSYHSEYIDKKQNFAPNRVHDWACVTGDTKIRTLSGWKNIIDLVNKEFYVWSYDIEQHRLVPAKAEKCWKTKTVNKIIKITLDNDVSIKVTPEHKFMLRDEQWIEAQNLKVNDSLMPLYERLEDNKGWIKVHLNDGTLADEHKFVYSVFNEFLKDGYIIHHEDLNIFNNNPENLKQLTIAEHCSIHSKEPERLKKLRINSGKCGNKKSTAHLIQMNKKRSGNNHHTKQEDYWTDELRKKTGEAFIKNWKESEKMKTCEGCKGQYWGNWKRLYCCDKCKSYSRPTECSKEWTALEHSNDCRLIKQEVSNHKIIKIEIINGEFEVFDISVPKYNNFVAEGVVIHNSHGADAFQTMAFYVKTMSPMAEKKSTILEPTFRGGSGKQSWMGK